MRRIAPALPVPPNMFRHFAVITILITACIALFADGERRDAIGAELNAQKQKTAMVQAEANSLGSNKTKRKVVYYSAQGGGGAGDSGPADTNPMVNPEGSNQQVSDGGGFRLANGSDFGKLENYMTGPQGPPGLAEVRQGMTSSIRTGSPRKRGGGGGGGGSGDGGGSNGPTAAQRNAIDAEGFRRAGPPTPPKS